MLLAVWWLIIGRMLIKHFYTKSLIKCPQVWRTLCTRLDTAQYAASHHSKHRLIEASWNVLAHVQKPDFVFWRNGRFHLNRQGRQFSRLLAAELCVSAVIMLDTPYSEVVWRVLHQVPSHFNCSLPRFIWGHLGHGGRQMHICKLWHVHHTGVINY
jgi:hypothetical protein